MPLAFASDNSQIWDLRLPAYINLESQPYDPSHYRATLKQDKLDPKDVIGAKSRMLQVRNTIRWKWVTGPDGEAVSLSLDGELYD